MVTIKQQIARLKVFGLCKKYYEKYGLHPTAREVASALCVSETHAFTHMRALINADGIAPGLLTERKLMHSTDFGIGAGIKGAHVSSFNNGRDFDENYIELDKLLR